MKLFKFRLQKLLDLNKAKERLKQQELALALRRLENEQALLADLEEKVKAGQYELRDSQQKVGTAGELALAAQLLAGMELRAAAQRERVSGCTCEVAKRRSALLQNKKENDILEKLRGRQYHRYRRDFERSEQTLVDEMALHKHAVKGVQALDELASSRDV